MGLKMKNVLKKLTLREPIGFKMMMSSQGENIFGGKIRKCMFLVIFWTYILVGLLKFQVCTLVGDKIIFNIQRVATLHTNE